MKFRIRLLPTLLLLSSLLVAGLGGYIKYEILEPLGIQREESIIAMPFVLYSDKGLQFMVQMNREMMENPTTEATEEVTETTVVTEATELPETTETEVPDTTAAETDDPTEAATEAPTEAPTEATTEPPTEAPTEPVYVELEDEWFDKMLVIGDSRFQGMRNYYRFSEAYYFTSIGMNIYNVFGTWAGDKGHYECSLEETLATVDFDKVLVGIGLNECNYKHEYIEAGFRKLIDLIHEKQPDTKIILSSIMMVSKKYAKQDECFKPKNLRAINEIMKSLAEEDDLVYYLETNNWVVGDGKYLPDEVTFDGVHLYGTQYVEWAKWMRKEMGTLGIP